MNLSIDPQLAGQFSRTSLQLEAAGNKLQEITNKITKVTEKEKRILDPGDWTNVYKKWTDWEDIEELQSSKVIEEDKINQISNKTDCLGHAHDHSKEREFFEQSEEIKLQECEKYRAMGNYLFKEGLLVKAAENYQVAIGYYEYCFPVDNAQQKSLDALRHACLCNASLCYTRLGHPREAVKTASYVIDECKSADHMKARYRRAQAYRHLDEFELAMDDLRVARALAPGEGCIAEEIILIKRMSRQYLANSKNFAKLSLCPDEAVRGGRGTSSEVLGANDDIDDKIPVEPLLPEALTIWREDCIV